MLTATHLQRYADVLIWGLKTARGKRFAKGDIVLVRYDMAALPLAETVYAKLLELGLQPVQRVAQSPKMEHDFYALSNARQLVFRTPGEEELFASLNGSISLRAPDSITHLSDVRPEKIGRATVARKYINDILDRREAEGEFGWTLCVYPTPELAGHAGLTPEAYAAQIIRACFLKKADPVASWRTIYREAQDIKRWLNGMKVSRYHIESERTELTITPGLKRKWVGISGHNIPSFELFLSPDWRGTEGLYYADQPTYRSGNYVKGVSLQFKAGSVVKANAEHGEDFLRKQIAMDRGAGKLGEFSLTDKRFSRITTFMANTLYDENYGGKNGNCHVALGASYSDTYDGAASDLTPEKKKDLGFNDSALHWDLVNTEKKRVIAQLAGGKRITIYEDGMFVC
ncbi:MAG TPA: aminopeptidase [Deltaproteobacteria bacterium]|nr:aminopeptidase [Deltaproteobacteria bacterium]HPR56104.1 aminopeptidase [Deltaproteobacteria bacterium]HXK46940.1 aminopeptidase [Deltaproteobacteria bacterium]